MALIPCPECSTKVSDSAVACPKCGFPVAEDVQKRQAAEKKARTDALNAQALEKKNEKSRKQLLLLVLLLFGCCIVPICTAENPSQRTAASAPRAADESSWLFVSKDRVVRRTCPKLTCGSVGSLYHGERVEVLEKRDGWARVTKRYDAACENGVSKFVDKGKAACTAANGIVDGTFAEWAPLAALSQNRPKDPAKSAKRDEKMVAQSDDFKRHRATFVKVAKQLIAEGQCTRRDFIEHGGWVKSVGKHKTKPVYFTYCGTNRIYMNAKTGTVLK